MDALTAFKISEKERSRMQATLEQMQEDLMMNILRNGAITMGTGLAEASRQGVKGFMKGGYAGAAASVIASTPSVAASATKPLDELNLQKQKLVDFEWNLDVDKLKSLNELNKKFLTTYWDFLHNSDIPDSLRISEKQIANLLEVTKDKNPSSRYRTLVRLEKECGNIPNYWYYRADAAHDVLKTTKGIESNLEEKLVSDIQDCLARYREIAGMLRKDTTLSSLLMLHLDTANLTPEDAKSEISQIVEPFPLDASKRLFAALTSLKYGLTDDAIEHLNANLDLRQYEVISRKLLADIYNERKDEQKEATLLNKLISDDSTSNQEILYHLGKLRAHEKFMASLEPQLSAIEMRVKPNIMGDDDFEILMPIKWEIFENAQIPSTLKIGNKVLKSDGLELTKDKKISLSFKKAVKDSELAALHSVPILAEIQTRHFPIIIEGTMDFPQNESKEETGMLSKIKGTAKKIIPKSQGVFHIKNIKVEDITFNNDDGKWIRQR